MPSVRSVFSFLAVTAGIAGCNLVFNASIGGNAEPEPFEQTLVVARHANQPLSERRLDAIFATATELLQIQDEDCRDVACPVTFVREGTIERFDDVSSVITQESQLDDVFDHPGDIKVVSAMIGVCGSQIPSDTTVVLGCASRGGSVVIIADAPEDVWAHEWGHVQGLSHRNDCARNLMHAFELETNSVNEEECNAFLSPTPSRSAFRVRPPEDAAMIAGHGLAPDRHETAHEWAQRVTSRQYLAGLPAAACQCDRADDLAGALAALLDEPGCSQVQRANALRGLGLLGATQACPRLISELDGCAGNVTTTDLPAIAESFLALGRLVTPETDDPALAFLVRASDPASWAGRSLTLTAGQTAVEPLEGVLARLAVIGLALSDDPRAADHLTALQTRFASGPIEAPLLAEQVDQALRQLGVDSPPDGKIRRVYVR